MCKTCFIHGIEVLFELHAQDAESSMMKVKYRIQRQSSKAGSYFTVEHANARLFVANNVVYFISSSI